MRYPTWFLLSLCIGAVSQALAADPPQPAPAPAQPSVTPAAVPGTVPPPATVAPPTAEAQATAAASGAASDAKAASAKDAAVLEKQTNRLRSQGYKPRVQNGVTIFCRKEAEIGTRLPPPERCGHAEELDRASRYGKEITEDMQRKGNMTPRNN